MKTSRRGLIIGGAAALAFPRPAIIRARAQVLSVPQPYGFPPPNPAAPILIFDEGDYAASPDDIAALAMLSYWAQRGAVSIIGANGNASGFYAAPCIRALLKYAGFPSVPIGAWNGNVTAGSTSTTSASTTANGATAAGSNIIPVASIPAGVLPGWYIFDSSTSGAVPSGARVVSLNYGGAGFVEISANVAGAGVGSGDTIFFNVANSATAGTTYANGSNVYSQPTTLAFGTNFGNGPGIPGNTTGLTASRYPDGWRNLRYVLAQSNIPANSVTIFSHGHPGNLAWFIASPADAISPLTGLQLYEAKVANCVIMGGVEPGPGTEQNFSTASALWSQFLTAIQAAVSTTTGQLIPIQGISLATGAIPFTFPTIGGGSPGASNAFYFAINAYSVATAGATTFDMWDAMAAMLAVGQYSSIFQPLASNGLNTITTLSTGANTWTADGGAGNYTYMEIASGSSAAAFEAIVNTIVQTMANQAPQAPYPN